MDNTGELLDAIAQYGCITNMPLERLLALIRRASPKSVRKPRAVKLIAAGSLTQFMSQHKKRGGKECRGKAKRKDLLKQAVPVRLRRAKKKAAGSVRWHIPLVTSNPTW